MKLKKLNIKLFKFTDFNESHAEKIRRNLSDDELSKVLNKSDEKRGEDREENKKQAAKLNKKKSTEKKPEKKKELELELASLDTKSESENLIQEEGEGGGAEGGGGAQGSGDVSSGTTGQGGGGVAYVNQGTIGGMGAITNPTVSAIPGDPKGSIPGSGDRSFVLPVGTFTKNSGATGNKKIKMGSVVTKMKDFGEPKKDDTEKDINKVRVIPFSKFKSVKLSV